MKKVGLLTFHDEPNYGAFLQTYALSEAIKKLGYEVEVIDLRISPYYKHSLLMKILRPFIWHNIFEKAKRTFLKRSPKVYRSSDELRADPPDCDIYVLGSDQVWNKDITRDLKYSYFFDFVPSKKIIISYASSFGMKYWNFNDQETIKIKKLLERFSNVSVRESTAVHLCKNNCDIDAKEVVDPTLLLTDYSKLVGKTTNKKNEMVCFKFTQGVSFYNFLNEFKEKTGLEVKILAKTMPLFGTGIKNIPLPSIKTWLKSIAQAEFILTDSYHALLFSIIFEKKFIVMPANEKNFNRLSELLNYLNLSNRIYLSYDDLLKDDEWKKEIDFYKVKDLLDKRINSSKNFLNNSMSNNFNESI